jgi:hypothetical protein
MSTTEARFRGKLMDVPGYLAESTAPNGGSEASASRLWLW